MIEFEHEVSKMACMEYEYRKSCHSAESIHMYRCSTVAILQGI